MTQNKANAREHVLYNKKIKERCQKDGHLRSHKSPYKAVHLKEGKQTPKSLEIKVATSTKLIISQSSPLLSS